MRQEVRLEKDKRQRTTDFDVFLLFDIVVDDQKVFRSYKNSWR